MRRYRFQPWSIVLLLALAALGSVGAASAAASTDPASPELYHDHQDALTVPREALGARIAGEDDPSYYYPSAYMAGSVAVQILLPESTSSGAGSEDWQPGQPEAIKQSIDAALRWWQARVPAARLRFESEVKVVSTVYEPISYGLDNEGLWIGDALQHMGFLQQGYFAKSYASDDTLRKAHGTDWALTIFVVNSNNDPDGRFSDKRFAYAYIGGPFMVITSDGGPYNSANLAAVAAHEIGHLFGALDQYSSAQVPCAQRAGYLDVPNLNSRYGDCPSKLPSIMYDPLPSVAAGDVDPYALGQLGYRDSDGDGLIDVLDTVPSLELNSLPAPAAGQQPKISGRTVDQPYPGAFGAALTINKLDRFEYRVDGGNWQLAAPDSLAADGTFQLTLPLYDGQYSVGLRTINSVGAVSPVISRSMTVQGLGAAPTFTAQAPAFINSATVPVELGGPAQSFQLSTAANFSGAAWQPMSAQASFALTATTDAPYIFYARFRGTNGALSPSYKLTAIVDRTAPSGLVRELADGELVATASDGGSGVVEMQLNTEPQLASEGWLPYQPNISLPSGAHLLGVRFRDRAGNVSPFYTLSTSSIVALPVIIR